MAQTTIQGSFLGDATVTGAKIGADFISAQTALTTSLATTDEIIVSDAGVIKRIDISVWSASTETFTNKSIDLGTNTLTGSVAEFNTALQSESFATLGGTETLVTKTLTAPTINAGTLNLMTVLTVANDIDVGAYEVRALKFESDQATGTAPLTVASTTVVTNLNADLLDGVQGANYALLASPVFTTSIRITPQSSAPTEAVGTIYFDTEDKVAYVWDGANWRPLNTASTVDATGGTIDNSVSGYRIHIFTSSGTFTPGNAGNVDWLVVAGGGGGGGQRSGGGGAGGFRTGASHAVTAQDYTITVGNGGAGGIYNGQNGHIGASGQNSVFSTITSNGGGGGGGGQNVGSFNNGVAGGSGGGGAANSGSGGAGNTPSISPITGETTTVQGYAGGSLTSGNVAGVGGGGSSVAGADGTSATAGGAGTANAYRTGSNVTYAGGGGGGAHTGSGGAGGAGGGGAGTNSSATGGTGSANTGGGGGGSGSGGAGGAGGSGIVVIRYVV